MNKFFVYDGDTIWERRDGDGAPTRFTPRHERIEYRLDAANTPEVGRAGSIQATQATQHMLDSGFELNPLGEQDRYKRELSTLTREGDISGSQALVNAGMASPLPDNMNRTVNPLMKMFRDITGEEIPEGSIENDLVFRHLAEQARAERLARIDATLSAPGGFVGRSNELNTVADPLKRGHVDRAWDRGVDNMQATFYGFANALGKAAGIDVLAEWGEEGMARNIWEAMRSPASVGTWENIDSLADAGIYALEALVEQAPQLALDGAIALGAGALASTGAGAPAAAGAIMTRHSLAGIGKAVLRKAGIDAVPNATVVAREGIRRSDLFKEGARFGALSSMYPQLVGETQMSFAAEGVDAPGTALALGAPKALLDLYGFEKILGQAFKGLGKDAATPENVGQLLMGALKAGGIAASSESVTEATQYLIDELALNAKVPGREIEWSGAIDSLLKGGLVGGAASGATRLGVDALRMGANVRVPEADDPPQPTLTEPLRDIEPQLDTTPEGEGRWFTPENAEQAKAAAAERGLPVKENPDGSVFVAEQSVLDTIPEEPTQADIARVIGYAQTKDEALADPQGAVVVETRNAEGAVLRNQLVGRTVAETIRQQQAEKFPGAITEIKEVVDTIDERLTALEREQEPAIEPAPAEKWKAQGRLAQKDVAALAREAMDIGIDPSRFQKRGLGTALVERIKGGLQAVVPGNTFKRLDSLAPLAELLDMPAQELEASYYGDRSIIKNREMLHQVFLNRVQERFGSTTEFAKVIDDLPLHEAREIKEAFGIRKAEGGFDIGGLIAEIEARRPKPTPAPTDPEPSQPNALGGDESDPATEQNRIRAELAAIEDHKRIGELEAERDQLQADWPRVKAELDAIQDPAMRELRERELGYPAQRLAALERRISAAQGVDDALLAREPELRKALGQPDTPKLAQPDRIHRAVFSTPELRRVLTDDQGRVLRGDALKDRIASLPHRERLLLEDWFAKLDIDIGGRNRQAFLDLLEESISEQATYGIGKSRVDDTDLDSPENIVPTVEAYDPSRLDTKDARLLQLIKATPLTNRAEDGFPAGMALYLDGMARIIEAGEPETQALTEEESGRLHYARAVRTLIRGLATAVPGLDPADFTQAVADYFGLTDELVSKAAGREVSTLKALDGMADYEDRRVAVQLARQAAAKIDLGGSIEEAMEAMGEALQDDPAKAIELIAQDLRAMYGTEGVNRLTLIAAYQDARGERPVTATAKGHDAAQGENVAVDPATAYNEQAMSDSSFFGALRRYSISGWNMAILPSAQQLKAIRFRDGLAQLFTERFEGRNLLAIPEVDGSNFGRVIDAISLARYAQSGESPPASVAEAASNLAENLSRIMLGEQNSEREDQFGVAKGFLRTIPDDLVIFVNPETGEGSTWGQAMDQWRKEGNATERHAALTAELDSLVDEAGRLGEILAEAYVEEVAQSTEKARNRFPRMREAFELWGKIISGEKYRVDGREVYYRKPARKNGKLTPLGSAFQAVGNVPIKALDGETLADAHGRYLGILSRIKEVSRERRDAQADVRRSMGYEPDELEKVARDLDLDLENPVDMRKAEEALQGGQGTRVTDEDPENIDHIRTRSSLDAVDPEYDPAAHDPLAGLLDGEDEAQDAAIRAWLETRSRVSEEPAEGSAYPFFRLESTVTGTAKPENPLSRAEVEAVVEEFKASYNGHIPLLFDVRDTQVEVYGPASLHTPDGKPQVILGAYHPTGGRPLAQAVAAAQGGTTGAAPHVHGRTVVIVENAASREQLWSTLRHEVLGHFGLNTFPPEIKRQILDAILRSKNTPTLRGIWREIAERYQDMPELAQAEEVFAFIAEQEPKGVEAIWNKVLNALAIALRRLGLLKGKVTRAELAELVSQIAGGIRDGRARQRTWPQTDYDQFRRQVPSAAVLGAQAKRFWDKGLGATAPVYSMVYSRIRNYSPELALMLFQPAGKRASKAGQSWEQAQRALSARMMGQVDKVLTALRDGVTGKAKQQLAVQRAFEDAYSGNPQTEQGQMVRKLVDDLVAEATRAGLESAEIGPGFAPMAFDRKAVTARQAEFEALLTEKLGLDRSKVREIISHIVDGPGVLEGVIAPGMPVGMHQNTMQIVEAIGRDELIRQGWVLSNHEAALIHWVTGVSKRAAWERLFGGRDESRYELRNGEVNARYSPNAKFHAHLDQIRERHGQQAVDEVLALVNGALGRHPAGQSMPGWWRSTQEFITGWVGMTVLAFSGVASIPELALPLVRAGGKVGIGAAVSDFAQAKKLARDLGIVIGDASEQVIWQSTGEQYQSPTIQKMQSLFFKINGNNLIVRTSRILATGIAVRYLLHAAAVGDTGSLSRLNIDAGTVHAWDQAGRPAWSPDMDPVMADISSRVADAINQFVNEATLNPSRFQATHWGNNPWLKMIWHLKHFLYTYGDTVLGGMYREMRRRWRHLDPTQFSHAVAIAMPALIFGLAIMPLAAASLELRDWVRKWNGQRGKEYEDSLAYIQDIFARAGGLGPVEFLFNLRQQQEWGRSVFGAVAPVPGKVDTIFGRGSVESKVRQMIPIWSQNKGLPLPWE